MKKKYFQGVIDSYYVNQSSGYLPLQKPNDYFERTFLQQYEVQPKEIEFKLEEHPQQWEDQSYAPSNLQRQFTLAHRYYNRNNRYLERYSPIWYSNDSNLPFYDYYYQTCLTKYRGWIYFVPKHESFRRNRYWIYPSFGFFVIALYVFQYLSEPNLKDLVLLNELKPTSDIRPPTMWGMTGQDRLFYYKDAK